ncbi:hypothetical protein QOT17_007121 [Balamuthia mandrillaris]
MKHTMPPEEEEEEEDEAAATTEPALVSSGPSEEFVRDVAKTREILRRMYSQNTIDDAQQPLGVVVVLPQKEGQEEEGKGVLTKEEAESIKKRFKGTKLTKRLAAEIPPLPTSPASLLRVPMRRGSRSTPVSPSTSQRLHLSDVLDSDNNSDDEEEEEEVEESEEDEPEEEQEQEQADEAKKVESEKEAEDEEEEDGDDEEESEEEENETETEGTVRRRGRGRERGRSRKVRRQDTDENYPPNIRRSSGLNRSLDRKVERMQLMSSFLWVVVITFVVWLFLWDGDDDDNPVDDEEEEDALGLKRYASGDGDGAKDWDKGGEEGEGQGQRRRRTLAIPPQSQITD